MTKLKCTLFLIFSLIITSQHAGASEINFLYWGFLDRQADTAGRNYWQNQLDTGALTYQQIAYNIQNSSESTLSTQRGDVTRLELINALYQNLFGRPADADGLNYWNVQPILDELLLQAIVAGGAANGEYAVGPQNAQINAALRACMDATNLNYNEITTLNCVNKSITSLEGIELAYQLEYLAIGYNNIEDISVLASLDHIDTLALQTYNGSLPNSHEMNNLNDDDIITLQYLDTLEVLQLANSFEQNIIITGKAFETGFLNLQSINYFGLADSSSNSAVPYSVTCVVSHRNSPAGDDLNIQFNNMWDQGVRADFSRFVATVPLHEPCGNTGPNNVWQ